MIAVADGADRLNGCAGKQEGGHGVFAPEGRKGCHFLHIRNSDLLRRNGGIQLNHMHRHDGIVLGRIFLQRCSKGRNVLLRQRKARCHGMPAELHELFAAGGNGIDDAEALHTAGGAACDAAGNGNDDAGLAVTLQYFGSGDADYAKMPVTPHYGKDAVMQQGGLAAQ